METVEARTRTETTQAVELAGDLEYWLQLFYSSREAAGRSVRTLEYYQDKLTVALKFFTARGARFVSEIDGLLLAEFLKWLSDTGHNPGGRAGFWRALKAYVRFWRRNNPGPAWINPFDPTLKPTVPEKLLEPARLEDIAAMLRTCDDSPEGIRDRAILMVLIDAGIRAAELLGLDYEDVEAYR